MLFSPFISKLIATVPSIWDMPIFLESSYYNIRHYLLRCRKSFDIINQEIAIFNKLYIVLLIKQRVSGKHICSMLLIRISVLCNINIFCAFGDISIYNMA